MKKGINDMKETARLAALILCLILVTQTLACAGDTDTEMTAPETETAEEETTRSVLPTNLPDMDWQGREFRVLGYANGAYPQFSSFEIYSDGETGEVVIDAVYRRNRLIEEKYNVKITQNLDDHDDMWTATTVHIYRVVTSQEDLYDLVFCNVNFIGSLARDGMFHDINGVDYIDFSSDYWNPEVNAALSYRNKLYFTTSDFSLRDKNRAYILIYNRDLAKDHGFGNIVDLVRAGTWTIDKMTEYSKAVAGDANGNGVIDDKDNFGTAMDSYVSFATFMVGCDNTFLTKTSEDTFELTIYNEHAINSIDKVLKLTGTPSDAVFCEDWSGKVDYDYWYVANTLFNERRVLFITTFPHELKIYSAETDFEYGIIPFPKYDEQQKKHYTMADYMTMLFAIPATNPEPDFAGFMLEALSSASTSTSLQAYYEISCKTKYTYDEESAEMLDLIFSNIVFEPAVVYNIGDLTSIYFILAESKANNFASLYKEREKMATTDLENLARDFDS